MKKNKIFYSIIFILIFTLILTKGIRAEIIVNINSIGDLIDSITKFNSILIINIVLIVLIIISSLIITLKKDNNYKLKWIIFIIIILLSLFIPIATKNMVGGEAGFNEKEYLYIKDINYFFKEL